MQVCLHCVGPADGVAWSQDACALASNFLSLEGQALEAKIMGRLEGGRIAVTVR
jgi:hypothetical protein